jgi:vesicle coat complex subunit
MGCIRVDKITEYLCEPLRKCLKDEDPYVRKTAAVCVAKLYDINAQLVEDQGFLDQLKDLLSDSNPMVCLEIITFYKLRIYDVFVTFCFVIVSQNMSLKWPNASYELYLL